MATHSGNLPQKPSAYVNRRTPPQRYKSSLPSETVRIGEPALHVQAPGRPSPSHPSPVPCSAPCLPPAPGRLALPVVGRHHLLCANGLIQRGCPNSLLP